MTSSVEYEDLVLTRLTLSTQIISRYDRPVTTSLPKYCLPMFLKDDALISDEIKYGDDEPRTILNSVIMLKSIVQNNAIVPIVPTSINEITPDYPQTVFLTMRIFLKGQEFHGLTRQYLDCIIDDLLLFQTLNVNPALIDKSNIISYLSSMFLTLQNKSNYNGDIEAFMRIQEYQNFFEQNTLDPSKKWGSFHSRRLGRVLFIICLFLSPIMPFDTFSQECAKLFENVSKNKLNTLFYFTYKRDIWFALHLTTNGSLTETFALACALSDISPIILLQLCSFIAPIREGRFINRQPLVAPSISPELFIEKIQECTKTWVYLISLRFNNILPPKTNNVTFDIEINVFTKLGLNKLNEQSTDLRTAIENFFFIGYTPIFQGDTSCVFAEFPQFSSNTFVFALDQGNPVCSHFSFLKTLQSRGAISAFRTPEYFEPIRRLIMTNPHSFFNDHWSQPPLLILSFHNGRSYFERPNTSFIANPLTPYPLPSSLNLISSTLACLIPPSILIEKVIAERRNSLMTEARESLSKKSSTPYDQKDRNSRLLNKDVNLQNLMGSHLNRISPLQNYQPQPSSSTLPFENLLSRYTQQRHSVNENFQNFQPSLQSGLLPSSTLPLENYLFGNVSTSSSLSSSSFNRSNNNGMNINSLPFNNIFGSELLLPTLPVNNSLNLPPFEIPPNVLNNNSNNITYNNFNLRNLLNSQPSSSFSPSTFNSSSTLSTESFYNNNSDFGINSLNQPSNAIPSSSTSSSHYVTSQAGSSKSFERKSNENLSRSCNNFHVNHLIQMKNSSTSAAKQVEQKAKQKRLERSVSGISTSQIVPGTNLTQISHVEAFTPHLILTDALTENQTCLENERNKEDEKDQGRSIISGIGTNHLVPGSSLTQISPAEASTSNPATAEIQSLFENDRNKEEEKDQVEVIQENIEMPSLVEMPVCSDGDVETRDMTNEDEIENEPNITPNIIETSPTKEDEIIINETVEESIDRNIESNEKENENVKSEENENAITEESPEEEEFELLIETSYEPVVEDATSEMIVEDEEEENDEVQDDVENEILDDNEDELVDPDNCPVKCICGFNHLEEQTIFCEKCRIWKHIKCLKAEKYANSDDEYCCPDCEGKHLPISPSEAQDLVAKYTLNLEHLDFKTKQCHELKLSGALELQWKFLLENSAAYETSKIGKLIYDGRMRWAVIKKGQAGRVLAGFTIKAGQPVIGVNGIAAYMTDAKNYCTCYRNLSLSFLSEPIIIEMKGRNGGLAHEILPSCRPNCEIKFCIYKNNLYCYLVALCDIDNDDELTIAFPDNENLHVSCAESSSDCTKTCPSQKFVRSLKAKKALPQNSPSSKKRKII